MDPQNSQRLHLGLDAQQIAGLAREGLGSHSIFDSPFGFNSNEKAELDAQTSGLHFIPFGRVSNQELDEFQIQLAQNPDWLAYNVAALRPLRFEFVIFDTPPGYNVYLEQAVRAADITTHVVLPDAASYLGQAKFEQFITSLSKRNDRFRGSYKLINQMPISNRLAHEVRSAIFTSHERGASTNIPLCIHYDVCAAQAHANETPLLEYQPSTIASLDFQYLADWFVDTLN